MQTLARAKYSRVRGDNEASPFQQLIQKDSDICNNCFRLTHVTYERNYFVKTLNGDLWAKQVDRPARSWPRPDSTQYQHGDTVTDGSILSCECGIRHDTMRPVKKEKAMRYVERIARRLVEKDIDIDVNTLRMEAWHKLSQPEYQCRQDEVFSDAVSAAIR